MAKKKTYAVTVKITREVVLFVEARRPNGAKDAVVTDTFDAPWDNPWRDQDDMFAPTHFDPKTMEVTDVRPA